MTQPPLFLEREAHDEAHGSLSIRRTFSSNAAGSAARAGAPDSARSSKVRFMALALPGVGRLCPSMTPHRRRRPQPKPFALHGQHPRPVRRRTRLSVSSITPCCPSTERRALPAERHARAVARRILRQSSESAASFSMPSPPAGMLFHAKRRAASLTTSSKKQDSVPSCRVLPAEGVPGYPTARRA